MRTNWTRRDVPGGFDVVGTAHAGAAVTVTAGSASAADYRKGSYFQEAVTVNNGSASVWQSVTVSAVNGGASSTWPAGSVFIPQNREQFGHDADGNQTSDGRWDYTWDGENRLVRMVTRTAVGPPQRIDFAYDHQGRRIRKTVWPNTAGAGPATTACSCMIGTQHQRPRPFINMCLSIKGLPVGSRA